MAEEIFINVSANETRVGVIEQGLLALRPTGLIGNVRGEGCVWGIECVPIAKHSAEAVANEVVRACYLGDEQGRAIHLLGPLAGKVLRVSPPLTMDLAEARDYLDAMRGIVETLANTLRS